MKRTVLFVAVAMMMSAVAMAQEKELKVGDVTMTINPGKGAKIMSLKYKDQEVINQSRWPANLMAFEQKNGLACYAADEAPQNRKINADGKGWLSYENNGLLLTKKFADLAADQPAPGEAEIQIYVNRGKTYIELESQGAYTTLAPGAELNWTVRWYLQPVKSGICSLLNNVQP